MQAIAAENGIEGYELPWGGAWGAIALLDEQPVAFITGRDISQGLFAEDLWAVGGQDGIRGIAKLNEWLEETAEAVARKEGKPIMIGAAVRLGNTAQLNTMLSGRGYQPYAVVLAKRIAP
jgi:hypothetical protein